MFQLHTQLLYAVQCDSIVPVTYIQTHTPLVGNMEEEGWVALGMFQVYHSLHHCIHRILSKHHEPYSMTSENL